MKTEPTGAALPAKLADLKAHCEYGAEIGGPILTSKVWLALIAVVDASDAHNEWCGIFAIDGAPDYPDRCDCDAAKALSALEAVLQ